MGSVLFGYRIKNGKAFIDEVAAEKIRQLYKNYLAGLSLENAAMEAMLELERRKKALGRTDRIKPVIRKTAPVNFRFGEIKEYHDSPAAQAEYLYSLIESEDT